MSVKGRGVVSSILFHAFLMTAIPSKRLPKKDAKFMKNIKNDSTICTTVERCSNCRANFSIEDSEVFIVLFHFCE